MDFQIIYNDNIKSFDLTSLFKYLGFSACGMPQGITAVNSDRISLSEI